MNYNRSEAGNTRIVRKFLLLPRNFNDIKKWLCYEDIVERLTPVWVYTHKLPPPLNRDGLIYESSGYDLKWKEINYAPEALLNGELRKREYFADPKITRYQL